jgi:hypothetical protein
VNTEAYLYIYIYIYSIYMAGVGANSECDLRNIIALSIRDGTMTVTVSVGLPPGSLHCHTVLFGTAVQKHTGSYPRG